jgi:hypothetical protein
MVPSVGAGWPNARQGGQKVKKKNKCSMKNPWQRWKSYFPGQDFSKFGQNNNKIIYFSIYLNLNFLFFLFFIIFFNTLICTYVQYAKTCSNLQVRRRNDETCKLRKIGSANFSSNHKRAPPTMWH